MNIIHIAQYQTPKSLMAIASKILKVNDRLVYVEGVKFSPGMYYHEAVWPTVIFCYFQASAESSLCHKRPS